MQTSTFGPRSHCSIQNPCYSYLTLIFTGGIRQDIKTTGVCVCVYFCFFFLNIALFARVFTHPWKEENCERAKPLPALCKKENQCNNMKGAKDLEPKLVWSGK